VRVTELVSSIINDLKLGKALDNDRQPAEHLQFLSPSAVCYISQTI